MRILIIHHEAEYFAGAEKVLGYFLEGLAASSKHAITVAAVRESRVAGLIPPRLHSCWLPENARFSLGKFKAQVQVIRDLARREGFDLIHGWAVRDWELSAVSARLTRRPAVGTLHDHPRAPFLSKSRQRLMRWSAGLGLARIVCVSEAVRQACLGEGFPERKLRVVHNGLPPLAAAPSTRANQVFQIGFLGLFSARKGLAGLFEILDKLPPSAPAWELSVAGDAQEEEGRKMVADIKAAYSGRAWWPRVHWRGWVKNPAEFLASLDLLLCPSSEFDPFPTVLLEAGQAGIPVLAARVGGVAEIVADGQTGWLFEARDWAQAAVKLGGLLDTPALARQAGLEAKKRVEHEFAMERMVADYLNVYTDLVPIQK